MSKKGLPIYGLTAVDLIVSNNYKGLVKAINRHFQGTIWQRCQTHFSRNILDKTPKKYQTELKKQLHRIYAARDLAEARQLLKDTLDTFEKNSTKNNETIGIRF